MKKLIYMFAVCAAFCGCNDAPEFYELPTPDDVMAISVSPDGIVNLSKETAGETAVAFNWNAASNLNDGNNLTYTFKLGPANDANAVTTPVEMPQGVYSYSFTHAQLNHMLIDWKVTPEMPTDITATIIATPAASNHYQKPEVSTVAFTAVPYDMTGSGLYIVGSANPAGEGPENAIAMDADDSKGESYSWTGMLQTGEFILVPDPSSELPCYTKGEGLGEMVYNDVNSESAAKFSVSTPGLYTISVYLPDMSYTITNTDISAIWMLGEATPGSWTAKNASAMGHENSNTDIFVYEGPMSKGDFKLPLQMTGDFSVPYLMPAVDGTVLTDAGYDNRVEYISREKYPAHDYKWKIGLSGNHRIEIDKVNMTIKCEPSLRVADCMREFRYPDYKQVWMIGGPTPGGWTMDQGQADMFTYNAINKDDDSANPDNDEYGHVFVWEGYLKTDGGDGEIKFPLAFDPSWGVPFYMPLVGGTPIEDNKWMDIKLVMPGGPDDKFVLQQAGNYRVTLDAKRMRVKFKRLSK